MPFSPVEHLDREILRKETKLSKFLVFSILGNILQQEFLIIFLNWKRLSDTQLPAELFACLCC